MKLILRNNTDPYFNIAAEEYFLKNYNDDILMFWKSEYSVVVGKHQNTMAEVNINFTDKNNIPVIRRISGGGTVYHDTGNINYTVITSATNNEKLVDFVKFTKPIIGFLNTLGLKAIFEGKNNLTIQGLKFSGNSAHVFRNRILNHGTLLFNTNLDNLQSAISAANFTITDKGVKSIRANVANISGHLHNAMSISMFEDKLQEYFVNYFNIKSKHQLSNYDADKINELVENKYKLWDWNYGYSPPYKYTNKYKGHSVSMDIVKGIITKISLNHIKLIDDEICNLLINTRFNYNEIKALLSQYNLKEDELPIYLRLLGITRVC